MDLKEDNAHSKLRAHLGTDHYAMALLNLKHGVMHWVVISEANDSQYLIIDSLKANAYKRAQASLDKQLIGLILIQPQRNERAGVGKSHRTGLWEGLRSLFR